MAGQVVVELTARDKVSGVLNKINAASRDLQQNFGRTTKRLGGGFSKLKNQAVNLQGALGSIAIGAVVKGFADAGVQADRTAKRLKFLGDQFGESAKLQEFANQAAEKFTLGQTDAANAVGDLFGRLRPMGTSLDDIKTVFNGVNVAAKQMNLSTADTEGVMLQLSQALGSGRLQGDEFRSIMERLPKIGQAVAKSMGINVDQLKEFSSQGKITTKEIIKALKDIEKQGFPEADGVTQFNKAMKDLATTIGQRLTPILNPILKGIAGLVNKFLELPKPIQSAVIAFGAVATAFTVITPLLPIIAAGIGAIIATLTGPVGIVAAIAGVVAGFLSMRDSAKETKQPVKAVNDEAAKIKAAIEAAAAAKREFIEETKKHIGFLKEETLQITQAEQAYENTVKITDARLNAEREINSLQGQILERAYEQATSAGQRLQIAKDIFKNEVAGAKLAYQQTLNSIKAEQQRLEFRKQAAQVELEIIKAKGALAVAQEDNLQKANQIADANADLVKAQEANISMLDGQISAQEEIARHQTTAAQAQLEATNLAAQTKLEQRLVSKEINMGKTEANKLATEYSNSLTNSRNLRDATGQVSRNASDAAFQFIQVASEADRAATAIFNAARQQRALNAARAQQNSNNVEEQAAGGYNLGSFKAFAKGGVVRGPTLGLIGEGGEPEYIIPQSKAAGFAANFLAGKRGAGAIPGFAEGGMAVPSTANVSIQTGPVTQMNGADYVTTRDLSLAVQAGVNQTLDLVRRDNSTRRSLGII